MMKYSELSAKLADQVEAVCKHLLPNGTIDGQYYCASGIDGMKGQSLKVALSGRYQGKWRDWALAEYKGDLLDLWANCRGLELCDSYEAACRWLGIENPQFVGKEKTYRRPVMASASHGVSDADVKAYLENERNIPWTKAKQFGVTGHNGTIVFNYWRDGELINRKALPVKRDENGKKLPARFEKDCELTLFGWDAKTTRGRSITLCEGEIDAMSLSMYGIDAVSIPNGAVGTSWIENDYDRLSRFDTIYLCFDTDDAGQKGALEHAKRLGIERCRNVLLPLKDANECWVKSVQVEEMEKCFSEAKSFDPSQLHTPGNFKTQVLSLIYPPDGEALGYDSPWLFFNQKIFFDKAGLSVWTGVNGHGKTQFLNHLACYWMSKGAKVCISSLEIEAAETLQNLINVLSCKNTNPRLDNKISQEYALSCMDWLNNDRLWLYDEFGGANAKELLNVLQYAHRKYGIDIFVIDSLSLINIDDDDYNSQSNFVRELVRFKKQNNCHVHLVVHPRKGTDENKLVGKFDFKGSGTITNLADNCFSITRNKAKELAKYCQEIGELLDEEDIGALSEKDAFVWCMKQRKGGHEGKFGFVVDLMAKRYKSCESERLVPYVEYFSGKKIT